MNLLNKLLSRMGYVPKKDYKDHIPESKKFDCFNHILDSFGVVVWRNRICYYSGTSVDRSDQFNSESDLHRYIYDRGIKAIIQEHEKECKT